MMPQNYSEFNSTLQLSDPPKDWPDALKAMWYDAQENWEAAHDIAQARNPEDSSKVRLILNEIDATDREVPDPYYDSNDGFENVFQMIDEACEIIAAKINN